MRSRAFHLLAGISLVVLSGCNPYNPDFACKSGSFGSCSPTPDIYKQVVDQTTPADVASSREMNEADEDKSGGNEKAPVKQVHPVISEYKEAELRKVTSLLKQSVTPIVVPPKVMRILFMPFETEDGMLNMPEYAYIMLDKPKWVMGDYLLQRGER